jgi:hypothetical protein
MAMVKIFFAGIVGVVMGLVWFVSGLTGAAPDSPFAGGLWKGPLAFTVGVIALYISIKEMSAQGSSTPNEFPENTSAPNPDAPPESN